MYQHTCDVTAPDGHNHWDRIILHMAHEFLDPLCGFSIFEILTTRMIRMIRMVWTVISGAFDYSRGTVIFNGTPGVGAINTRAVCKMIAL